MSKLSAGLKSNRRHRFLLAGVLLAACGGGSVALSAQAAISGPLADAVAAGKQTFLHDTFGGNHMTCASCHSAAGLGPTVTPSGGHFPSLANAATIFPHYSSRAGKVITIEDQVQACVSGGLGGKPPAYGSITMNELVSYLTSLSQGKPMDMGGKPK